MWVFVEREVPTAPKVTFLRKHECVLGRHGCFTVTEFTFFFFFFTET